MLFIFRVVPGGKLWNNYSVLYVEASIPENTVLSILEESGCSQIISLSNQLPPFISTVTPVLPASFNDYLNKRLNYFYDRDGDYKLYYVKKSQKKYLESAVEVINNKLTSKTGIDTRGNYPVMVPLACLFAFILLLIFSDNKILFALSSFIFLLLSAAVPFYPTACGVLILMSVFFICQRLWKRKGSLIKMLHSFRLKLLSLTALAVILFNSLTSALLGILAISASISSVFLYGQFMLWKDSKASFDYLPIFSAGQISLFTRKSLKKILLAPAFILILMVFFITDTSFATVKSNDVLELPSPVKNSSQISADLPQTQDYYDWSWKMLSFPYKNLNKDDLEAAPHMGDSVSIPSYEKSSEGIIQWDRKVLTYDDEFIDSMDNQVKDSGLNIIENILIDQGRDLKSGYTSSGRNENQNFIWSLILIIISAIVIPLIWLFQFFAGRNK
ncbi:hypothetical protein [Treponema sp.]|uniref:hypothetical protein n=1 Tax=Treponema sp. TaxID=166 RepID=UPI0025F0C8D7|nr:hypothetical protein [Treponema sp.]MCR5217347.1 hypothetical protein [Treponema sp.]